jgi:arylsulfatase A-like enzyme
MVTRLITLLLVAHRIAAAPNATRPNLFMFLVDDLGYNSFYNNADHLAPTVKKLAQEEGVVLESAYSYKYCSPTRGSFLSGRYPYKLDATRCNIIPWTILDGLDLRYTLLPQRLKAQGYATHHIGKW